MRKFIQFLLLSLFPQFFVQMYGNAPTYLLKKGGEEIKWGQSGNHSNNCNLPTYNMYCPTSNDEESVCGHKYAGCAATALGQVFYYWEWPLNANGKYYDWSRFTPTLQQFSGDYIPSLLLDVGNACSMNYWNAGSWATPENVEDALSSFSYNVLERNYDLDDWEGFENSWKNLIKSEILSGRPVIMLGAKKKENKGKSLHYYIIDGYSNDSIHINWGWKGNNNGFYPFEGHDYTLYQKAFVMISPIYPTMANNVTNYSITNITNDTEISAHHTINLPASGSTLTINPGASLILVAGNSVSLKSGFTALSGSSLIVRKNPNYQQEYNISYSLQNEVLTPKCQDGVNDVINYTVNNSNSWECYVRNRNGKIIWMGAGLVENGIASVWDGSVGQSYLPLATDTYWIEVLFKNNFGRTISTEQTPIFYSASLCNNLTYSLSDSSNINGITYETDAQTWICDVYSNEGVLLSTANGITKDGTANILDKEAMQNFKDKDYFLEITFSNFEGLEEKTNLTISKGELTSNKNQIKWTTKKTNNLTDFSLSPNPAHTDEIITINYELKHQSNVSIIITDIYGKIVKSILNDIKESGHHSVNFKTDNIQKGNYIVTIRTSDKQYQKEILIH